MRYGSGFKSTDDTRFVVMCSARISHSCQTALRNNDKEIVSDKSISGNGEKKQITNLRLVEILAVSIDSSYQVHVTHTSTVAQAFTSLPVPDTSTPSDH